MEPIAKIYNIYFDGDVNAVVMDWDGYATSIQFKEGTELMLNTLIKNNATKVLADVKDMVLIGMEDQQWLNDFFVPRAINFGLKALAIVRPDYYFNKVAVESVASKVDKEKLTINFFDQVDEAKDWLSGI